MNSGVSKISYETDCFDKCQSCKHYGGTHTFQRVSHVDKTAVTIKNGPPIVIATITDHICNQTEAVANWREAVFQKAWNQVDNVPGHYSLAHKRKLRDEVWNKTIKPVQEGDCPIYCHRHS